MITGKKILFTSHTANFSKFNRPLMQWLKSHGNEVHYASAGEEVVPDRDQHFDIPFARNPFKLSNIHAYKELKKVIDREAYDIIHTHTPVGSVVTRLAARQARKTHGTRVLYTAHGFHFFKGAPLLNWLTYYPTERLMAKLTNTLITINIEDYDRARRQFDTEVRYVPGVGINQAKFDRKVSKPVQHALRTSLGLSDDDIVLLYLAELSKRKNQLWLINSIAPLMHENPKLHLLLAGMDSLGGACQKLVADLGLEQNIHFLGYRSDIVELLSISDIAVSSSLQEGLPVNIMEAMYTGLPMVAVDCRGSRDLIKQGVTGFLVHKTDAAGFRTGIHRLASDPELRRQFAAQSRQIIQQNYVLEMVMPEVERIYSPKPIVIHVLNSTKFSGAEHVACELIKDTDGYEAYYCSPHGEINAALEARGIRHIGVERLNYGELKRVMQEYKPAIIHAHDFRASIIASFFAKKTAVISHIHQNPAWLNTPGINYYTYKLRTDAFRKILVVTDAVKDTKIFNTTPAHKLITRHNIIDKAAILKKAGKAMTKKYDLAFCGRLEDVKQPLDFIRLVATLRQDNPNIKAVMIGDGSLRETCQQLIDELGLSKNITLVGFQPNPYPYIKGTRFLVITSKAEGFGLVAIEAMVLDTIVLSYDIASIREIMGSDNNTIGTTSDELATIYRSFDAQTSTKQLQAQAAIVERFTNTARTPTDTIYEGIHG